MSVVEGASVSSMRPTAAQARPQGGLKSCPAAARANSRGRACCFIRAARCPAVGPDLRTRRCSVMLLAGLRQEARRAAGARARPGVPAGAAWRSCVRLQAVTPLAEEGKRARPALRTAASAHEERGASRGGGMAALRHGEQAARCHALCSGGGKKTRQRAGVGPVTPLAKAAEQASRQALRYACSWCQSYQLHQVASGG
jgi:hypothetical protein